MLCSRHAIVDVFESQNEAKVPEQKDDRAERRYLQPECAPYRR